MSNAAAEIAKSAARLREAERAGIGGQVRDFVRRAERQRSLSKGQGIEKEDGLEKVKHASGGVAIFTEFNIFTDTVNKLETVKIEGSFEAEALRILRDTPGISVISREPKQAGDHRADATVRFAGTRANITVEVKRRANTATAWQLVHRPRAHHSPPFFL